jgi:hypothetical protein
VITPVPAQVVSAGNPESPQQEAVEIERGKWIEGQLPYGPAGPEILFRPAPILANHVIDVAAANHQLVVAQLDRQIAELRLQLELDRLRAGKGS